MKRQIGKLQQLTYIFKYFIVWGNNNNVIVNFTKQKIKCDENFFVMKIIFKNKYFNILKCYKYVLLGL